jgi:hypothetical protein
VRKGRQKADAHVTAHLDHAAHGDRKIPVDHAALREVSDVSVRTNLFVTAENNRARLPWHEADERFEKCGLARAVRPEQRNAMTAAQVEADVMHRRNAMISNR